MSEAARNAAGSLVESAQAHVRTAIGHMQSSLERRGEFSGTPMVVDGPYSRADLGRAAGELACALAAIRTALSILVLLSLVACVSPRSGPDVVVAVAAEPAEDATYIRRGATAWRELGFEFVDASELPDCSRFWYQRGEFECRLFVVVDRYDLGDEIGGLADRGARRIILSTRLAAVDYGSRMALWSTSAHEFGHILLNYGEHLPPGAGIMSPSGFDGVEPSPADLELACEQIGVCP